MERENKKGGVAEKYEWGDFFVRKLQILAFTPFLSIIRIRISLTWGKKMLFFSKTEWGLINKKKNPQKVTKMTGKDEIYIKLLNFHLF